ncbi:ATP-binding protein [Campylobacter hepaticus]|uniref:ATP-binding protein n=1 Tax=Campylobacter hepaticus TaxID=1813019 RepID=A0A424Z0E8_9BACT|nr:ATP-binding protein [Campylobacter hepaticus]RQD67722.1 ATP-binding protein [Campylobacter hepaticus]RQD87509.1 ATP-binding protein [Campylobacter hepaticus]
MKVLNFFYENPPKFEVSYKRKIQILNANTILKGPKFCGKKTLIFNYLSQFKTSEVLFLNMDDTRFERQSLDNLSDFLNNNLQIKILCLYNLDFIPDLTKITIPMLLSTNKKDLVLEGFEELELDYFDFEEFISIHKKNLPINHLVGLFLQSGRSEFGEKNILLRQNFNLLELEILKYLALNLGQQISISKIFIELKKILKTSKDSVYYTIKELENTYMIYILKHDEKKLQKIYFRDFGLRNNLCISKNFIHLFENLVLNELFKFKQELFYNKYFSFYSKKYKIAYISSPTLDIDLIKLRAKKILSKALELGIFHVIFITLSNEDSFFEQGVKFEIIPFDKFSLGF